MSQIITAVGPLQKATPVPSGRMTGRTALL